MPWLETRHSCRPPIEEIESENQKLPTPWVRYWICDLCGDQYYVRSGTMDSSYSIQPDGSTKCGISYSLVPRSRF